METPRMIFAALAAAATLLAAASSGHAAGAALDSHFATPGVATSVDFR